MAVMVPSVSFEDPDSLKARHQVDLAEKAEMCTLWLPKKCLHWVDWSIGETFILEINELFRYKAENGKSGGRMQRHGADGNDFLIQVPVGTKIKQVDDGSTRNTFLAPMSDLEQVKRFYKFKSDYTPQLDRVQMLMERIPPPEPLFQGLETDLVANGERKLVAKGGKGGFGNPHFVTPQIPGPSIAGKGIEGTSITLELELKTLADAGLVGLPNAGKSYAIKTR